MYEILFDTSCKNGELCAYKKQWIMYVQKLWTVYFLFPKFKVQMARILWRWHSSHSDSHDNDSRGDSLSKPSKVYSRIDRPYLMPHRCQRRFEGYDFYIHDQCLKWRGVNSHYVSDYASLAFCVRNFYVPSRERILLIKDFGYCPEMRMHAF